MKIYRDNNYLVIEHSSGEVLNASASKVEIREVVVDNEQCIILYNVPGMQPHAIKFSEVEDNLGNPYTLSAFRNFYKAETGKGIVIAPPMTQTEYDALTDAQKNDGTTYIIY